jgi:hypothetical protein
MGACTTPASCRWGHLPNCPASGNAGAIEVGNLKPTAREKQQPWYPKGPDGKPVPDNKLTEHDKALILSGGDEKNIVIKKGHAYAKKNKRRK